MSRKLFVVSDVHGHFAALMEALYDAGFDRTNEDHIFVCCGDLFDRGTSNALVYDFVRSLERKILLRGNHEDMLREVLAGGKLTEDAKSNKTVDTVLELLGADAIEENENISPKYAEKSAEIIEFIDSMLDFYEEGKYIFTHGWLPHIFEGGYRPAVDPAWREADEEIWKKARWSQWQQFYRAGALLDGKIIVCGHRPARLGYWYDESRANDDDTPFFGNGMIAIDAYTVKSKRVNVLVCPME
jgi:hypothetical protein